MKDTFQKQIENLHQAFQGPELDPKIQKAYLGYEEALIQTHALFKKVRKTDFLVKSELDSEKNSRLISEENPYVALD